MTCEVSHEGFSDVSTACRLHSASSRPRGGGAPAQDRAARAAASIPVMQVEEERWNGDSMIFASARSGRSASGQVDVADDHVQVEVVLPWLLQRFAEMAQADRSASAAAAADQGRVSNIACVRRERAVRAAVSTGALPARGLRSIRSREDPGRPCASGNSIARAKAPASGVAGDVASMRVKRLRARPFPAPLREWRELVRPTTTIAASRPWRRAKATTWSRVRAR